MTRPRGRRAGVAALVGILAAALFLGASAAGAAVARAPALAAGTAAPPRLVALQAPVRQRSLSGVIQEVRAEGLTVLTGQGRQVSLALASGAVVKLNGRVAALERLRPGDRVTAVGQREGTVLTAKVLTARRPPPLRAPRRSPVPSTAAPAS